MRRALVAAGILGLLAGCTAGADSKSAAVPDRPAAERSGSPDDAAHGSSTERLVAAAGMARCPQVLPVYGAAPSGLPGVTLRCLGAGPGVLLSALRGPAVVNLWASWCSPCREEMPRLQALHTRAGSRLLVLGVVTDDDPNRALSTAGALGVHYASVLDVEGAVRRSYGYPGPPITLLVDRNGTVVRRIPGPLPSLPELTAAVSRYLSVHV